MCHVLGSWGTCRTLVEKSEEKIHLKDMGVDGKIIVMYFKETDFIQWPNWCTNFNTFITILYMYMFRAISYSSSEGQIVLIRHLVSSLSVSDRPVHRLRKNVTVSSNILFILRRSNCINTASGIVTLSKWPFGAQVCTGRSLTESDDTRCCINALWPPEDEQDIARNMYM